MIVVGILSIIFGILLAIWTFIQRQSDVLDISADTLTELKEYIFVPINEKLADPGFSEFASKLEGFKRSALSQNLVVEGLSKNVATGLYITSAIIILVGILCIVGFVTFDAKRRNVQKATAIERFNEGKTMFFAGIGVMVAGIAATVYAWIQNASFAYKLQRKIEVWNTFVDKKGVKIDQIEASWAEWIKVDEATALAHFNAGEPVSTTVNTIITVVGIVAIFVGAIMLVNVVGNACKTRVYPVFNGLILCFIALIILFPIYKTLIDSIDGLAGSGLNLTPKQFTMQAYKDIVTEPSIYTPFLVSLVTTVVGTLLGLTLSTLGAYVLIQFEMPGRTFFANMLLFTMIFSGGMIPSYLLMQDLGLLNTLWAVILPLSINVYNLVLMRNFFEGIPASLFEAAQIDGCTPMQTFIKIVLPLSKAAIASIGLMFAVTFWNDYTNFQLYLATSRDLHNFQMKLRTMIMGSDTMTEIGVYAQETMQAATVVVAVLPFMILYPFCQNYFVQGVNVGAVKE